MADDFPDDWSIPTFRELSEPVTMFGLPPEMAMLPVLLGGGAAALLVIVSTAAGSIRSLLAALIVAVIAIPAGLFFLRHIYRIDPHFFEHLTTHRFPACRYLGK